MLPQPRLRFLLADDPVAGKTIMAGLLVKELKLREAIERVLILCPAPLTIQWQDELLRWFGEPFDIIFSALDQQQLVNPWQKANQVIASMDYAKQDDVRERVWQQRWDLVIIDEAHSSQGGDAATDLKEVLGGEGLRAEARRRAAEEGLDHMEELFRSMAKRGKQANLSFFAFTATPKAKTLELFGARRADGKFEPFHLYSMRQAIEV